MSPSTTQRRTHGLGRRTRSTSSFSPTRNCSSISVRTAGILSIWRTSGRDGSRPLQQRRGNSEKKKTRGGLVRRRDRCVGTGGCAPFVYGGVRREPAAQVDRIGHQG